MSTERVPPELLSGDGAAPVPTGRVPPRSSAYEGDEPGELESTDPIAFVVDMVQWSRRFTDEDLERLRSDAAYAKEREGSPSSMSHDSRIARASASGSMSIELPYGHRFSRQVSPSATSRALSLDTCSPVATCSV